MWVRACVGNRRVLYIFAFLESNSALRNGGNTRRSVIYSIYSRTQNMTETKCFNDQCFCDGCSIECNRNFSPLLWKIFDICTLFLNVLDKEQLVGLACLPCLFTCNLFMCFIHKH